MKICLYFKDLDADYIFTNEGLKEGDKVFPIVRGRVIDGEFYYSDIILVNGMISTSFDYCTGFPKEPHTIVDLKYDESYKSYEVRTDHGYGPVESYFKIERIIPRSR